MVWLASSTIFVCSGSKRASRTLRTCGLRKRPFSFSEGLSAVFDYTPLSANYEVSATPQIADARAIGADFLVTGNDMRAALADYAREQ
jgi:hypothetical protein